MTECTCSPIGGTPQCTRSATCPAHDGGLCAERKVDGLVTHLGPGFLGGVSHKGKREDCSLPDCEWPRQGDSVTAMSGSVERTGKLVDFHIVQTSPGNGYVVATSTIRRPDWGMYCRHGLKIVEAEPAEHTFQDLRPLCTLGRTDWSHQCSEPRHCPACHPVGRKVQPWPCQEDGCTEEDFERGQQAEIDEYYESLAEHARADW